MDILLTDEEIDKAFNEHSEYTLNSIRRNAVARAQLRKVVEWMDIPCHEHSGDVLHPHRRCGVCLQALKKEVE